MAPRPHAITPNTPRPSNRTSSDRITKPPIQDRTPTAPKREVKQPALLLHQIAPEALNHQISQQRFAERSPTLERQSRAKQRTIARRRQAKRPLSDVESVDRLAGGLRDLNVQTRRFDGEQRGVDLGDVAVDDDDDDDDDYFRGNITVMIDGQAQRSLGAEESDCEEDGEDGGEMVGGLGSSQHSSLVGVALHPCVS